MEEVRLTKDQVNSIAKGIMLDVDIKLNELVVAEKEILKDKLEIAMVEIKAKIEPLFKIKKQISDAVKKFDKLKDNINREFPDIAVGWVSEYGSASIDDVESDIINNFYIDNNLVEWQIDILKRVIETKVKAVLATLAIAEHSKVVDKALETVNVDDLFKNREKYI